MAMTATISTSPASTAVTEQQVTAIVTVSNSAAYPVTLISCIGNVLPTGAGNSNYNSGVSIGPVNFGPNVNMVVPAGGSLVVTFPIKFHAPSTGYAATLGSGTYSVGALCRSDDGSEFSPTASTITVNYVVDFQ